MALPLVFGAAGVATSKAGLSLGAAAAKVAAVATEVAGAVYAVKSVDDLIGSPLQRAMGMETNSYPSSLSAIDDEEQRALGFARYLKEMERIAPSFVRRNHWQLADDYQRSSLNHRDRVRKYQTYFRAGERPGDKVRRAARIVENAAQQSIEKGVPNEKAATPQP